MDCIEFTLSKKEEQIMNTLWEQKRELTRSEIIDLTNNKTWKDSSIHILLNQLLDKGAIEVSGEVQKGIVMARTYIPSISKEEYETMQFKMSTKDVIPSSSAFINFFANFMLSDKLNKKDIEKLKNLLEDKEEKMKRE